MSKKHLEQKLRDKAAERDRYMSELFIAEERIQTLEDQCRHIDDRNIELESEIQRLRDEVDTLTELLADALPKLVERLKLINQVAQLEQLVLSLDGKLEASRDFCDLYRASIIEALRKLDNPHLTMGGCAEAAGTLRKAVGQLAATKTPATGYLTAGDL